MTDDMYNRGFKPLLLYTPIPELWEHYNTVASVSVPDAEGYLTLSAMDAYLRSYEGEDFFSSFTPREFWSAMSCFLASHNSHIAKKRKK